MQLKLHKKVIQSLCFGNVRGQYALLELVVFCVCFCFGLVFFFGNTKTVVAKIYNHVRFISVSNILSVFCIWKVKSSSIRAKVNSTRINQKSLGQHALAVKRSQQSIIRISAENKTKGIVLPLDTFFRMCLDSFWTHFCVQFLST